MPVGADLKVGDEVNSWCTKCHEMRMHKVRALRPDGPPRVVCICPEERERNYRPKPPNSRKKKLAPEPEVNPWPTLIQECTDDKLRDYSIQERFWEGEYIKHRKYGIGIVTEMLDVNKMAVWFEDKKRIMVFNK